MKEIILTLALALPVASQATPLVIGSLATITSGETISYEKKGDLITIKRCEPYTLVESIERGGERCTLASEFTEIEMTEKEFRNAAQVALKQMVVLDKITVGDEGYYLLKNFREKLPATYLEDVRKRDELEKTLIRYLAFKNENPKDVGAYVEFQIRDNLKKLSDRAAIGDAILNAKKVVSKMIDQIIIDMDESRGVKVLRYSSEGKTLRFSVLRKLAYTYPCTPSLEKRQSTKINLGWMRYTYPAPDLCFTRTDSESTIWKVSFRRNIGLRYENLKDGTISSEFIQ